MRHEQEDLDSQVEDEWKRFRGRLADRISAMEVDEVLYVQAPIGIDEEELEGTAPYVLVLRWDTDDLRAEVVSNPYLDERYALTAADEDALLEMGWEAAEWSGEEDEEPVNFHVDAEPREADRIAAMMTTALRDTFGCVHPSFLVGDLEEISSAEHGSDRWTEGPEEPEELAVMPTDDGHLRALVDAALRVMFGDDLSHDEDGDIPVVDGKSVVWVRVLDDSPVIDLFAHVVLGVSERSRVAVELDLLNRANQLFKFVLVDDYVVMKARLVAVPFAPGQLRGLLALMLREVDDLARELAVRLGGRRFLETATDAEEIVAQETTPEVTALTSLIEALHEGPMRPSSIAVLFDHDRLAIISSIVAIRRDSVAIDTHDQEFVLSHLRQALRFVIDGEARTHRVTRERRRPPRRSSQLTLMDVEGDGQDTLDSGEWEHEVS